MILFPTIDVPVREQMIYQKEGPDRPIACQPLLDLLELTLGEIVVGQAQYKFKRPLRGWFDMSDSSFRVDHFSPSIVGYGCSPSKARAEWELAFHCFFQELVALRPYEFSSEQAQMWTLMEKYMDTEAYHNSTPLVMTQIGRIYKVTRTAQKYPKQISWLDGLREEVPPLNAVPDNFVALHLGQYFEAIVIRNRLTGDILKIVDCKRLSKWEKSNKEIEAMEESLFAPSLSQ